MLRDAKGSAGVRRKKLGYVIAESDQGDSRVWPRFASSRLRVIAPLQEAVAIRTPLRSTNSAKLRVLDEQHRGGDRGYEARMKALHRQLCQRSELGAAAVLGCRRDCLQPSARRSFPAEGLGDSADEGDFLLVPAPAELRSAALLFRARRLACSPPLGRVFYDPRAPRAIDYASRA